MREYELIIEDAFRNGLTPFEHISFNQQLLTECLGFRVGKIGLELYEQKESPLSAALDLSYDWPFPQVVEGERYRFLIIRDSEIYHEDVVYLINDDSSVTYVTSVDELTYGVGELMELADFGLYAIMTNGVVMLYWDTVTSTWTVITSSTTIPMLRTICNFRGQAVGGGVLSTWHDCDETFYIWSKIGEIDFTPEQDNLAGFRRCPFGGSVYHTRQLGGHVIGYSSKGITKLSPVSEPVVTFGFSELEDIGLVNKGAIDGSLKRHIYVDEQYNLKSVNEEGIQDLGYKNFMEDLKGSDIIVKYDRLKGDFYIGNETKTFLLSPNGLSEIPQHPSALWSVNGETYMLPATEDDFEALVVTSPFDMGYAGQKTVFVIESDVFPVLSPMAAVDYYLNPVSYGTTDFKPLNNQGAASVIASGNAFAVRLKFDPTYDGTVLSRIKVRYKMSDLRSIRGVYAPPPRGQENVD
jgi:hypothetical protein